MIITFIKVGWDRWDFWENIAINNRMLILKLNYYKSMVKPFISHLVGGFGGILPSIFPTTHPPTLEIDENRTTLNIIVTHSNKVE